MLFYNLYLFLRLWERYGIVPCKSTTKVILSLKTHARLEKYFPNSNSFINP